MLCRARCAIASTRKAFSGDDNQELLRDITRATVVPILAREIAKGWHDSQLAAILADNADPRLVRAVADRVINMAPKRKRTAGFDRVPR